MGYRSEVAILIYTKDAEPLNERINLLMDTEAFKDTYTCNLLTSNYCTVKSNAELTYYHFDWIKWYGPSVTCLDLAIEQLELDYQMVIVGEETGDIDERGSCFDFPVCLYAEQGVDDYDLVNYIESNSSYQLEFDSEEQVGRFVDDMEYRKSIIMNFYHSWEDVYLANVDTNKLYEEVERLVKNPQFAKQTYKNFYSKRVISASVDGKVVGMYEVDSEEKLADVLRVYSNHRYRNPSSNQLLDY